MATMTFDPTDNPELDSEVQADQQESLEIGEQMLAEQENLLAGKYRDAEELERAYIELQKKLGSRDQDEDEEEEGEAEPDDENDEEVEEDEQEELGYELLEILSQEAETGEFSEETLAALDELSPREVADMFLDYQANAEPQGQEISETDIRQLQDMVGGEDNYSQMTDWAAQNLSQEEVQAFDQVIDRGDPMAVYFAVQALQFRYLNAEGFEGDLLTGKDPVPSGQGFRSQAELIRAMDDPRYDSDPAYRADVIDKLERSGDLEF
jgi:hypothetical protein